MRPPLQVGIKAPEAGPHPRPHPQLPEHLEGKSFAPLLDEPDRLWKRAAFSQYPRGRDVMGYSMRTDRYRLTRWLAPDGVELACELYDHQDDPLENENIAGLPANRALIDELTRQMQAGWKPAEQ